VNIVLLHYRYTPSVAGVELVMEAQARGLARAGHRVTVLSGSGGNREPGVRLEILPELLGTTREPTREAVTALKTLLRPRLVAADRVILHNVLSMPFHPALTAALWELADEMPPGRLIAWVHDLAALNPDYRIAQDGAFWPLLRRRHPAMRVVAISPWRAEQFAALTGTRADAVIPNGIDPVGFLNLPPDLAAFVRSRGLAEKDRLLLQPARILRRKNIELGLHLLAALREAGAPATLLVTGAPDEHNADSARYHRELLALRDRLGLREEALFLSEFFTVTKADLIGLYQLCDVLWFPSRQEGFGLPLLEGALHRQWIYACDLPPMNTLGLPNATFFDPEAPADRLAREFLESLEIHGIAARRAALKRYFWQAILPRLEAFLQTDLCP